MVFECIGVEFALLQSLNFTPTIMPLREVFRQFSLHHFHLCHRAACVNLLSAIN